MKREFAVIGIIVGIVVGFLSGWFIPPLLTNVGKGGLLDEIRSRDYMIVGTSADWPPFEYFNLTGTGEYEGFDIDLCNLIADRLNVTIEWSDMAFDALIPACESGLIDLIAAAMFITPERAEVLAYSVPYIRTNEVVIALENSTAVVNSIEDIDNYIVGVQTGTAEMWELEDHIPPIDYVDYPSAFTVIDMLVSGVIQIAFVDEPVFTVWSKTYNLKVLYTVRAEPTALFCRKGEPEFLDLVNNVILTAYKDGTLDALINKWFT